MLRYSFSPALLALAVAALLPACAHRSAEIGAYHKALRGQGFAAYAPPVGDPRNGQDWDKFGPGSMFRPGRQSVYARASRTVGPEGVQAAMAPANASPIRFFSGRRVSGYDFDGRGGWSLEQVTAIQAAAKFSGVTSVDVQFGRSWLANHFAEEELREKAAPRLRSLGRRDRRDLAVVQDAVWTDSLRFYFQQQRESGGSIAVPITETAKASLEARGFKVIDGGVQIEEPTFIAYRPLRLDGLTGNGHRHHSAAARPRRPAAAPASAPAALAQR